MNRREFLKAAGAGIGAYAVLAGLGVSLADIPSRDGKVIEGRKLNIAFVGIGGRGKELFCRCICSCVQNAFVCPTVISIEQLNILFVHFDKNSRRIGFTISGFS